MVTKSKEPSARSASLNVTNSALVPLIIKAMRRIGCQSVERTCLR